jgi:cytochrome oxidase assembly protein ShyY1
VTITGRLDELPSAGLAVGRAPPPLKGSWPRVTSYPRPQELAAALPAANSAAAAPRVEPRILLLDAQEPRGYVRDWKPGGRGPEQNWSYAIQWWSFAVVLLGLYVGLNLRRTPGASR